MWGVAKIFASGHSKGGFDRTPRTPLATGMLTAANSRNWDLYQGNRLKMMLYIILFNLLLKY